MAFSVSPSVIVREVDASAAVPAIATPPAAIAGVFNWGPTNEAILISSEDELVNRFGKPNDDNFETFFVAADYLSYANALWVARADTGEVKANADTSEFDAQANATIITQSEFEAIYPGSLGNSLQVAWSDSASYELEVFAASEIPTDKPETPASQNTLEFGATSHTFEVANTDQIEAYAIQVGDVIEIGNDSTGYYDLTVTGIIEDWLVDGGGAGANTTTVEAYRYTITTKEKYIGPETNWNNVSLTKKFAYHTSFENAPASGNYNIVVIDEDGDITGTAGAILEVYEDLSTSSTAQLADGRTNYYKTVLENNSSWIALRNANSAIFETSTNTNYQSLSSGTQTVTEATASLGQKASAYDLFRNPNEIDISFVLQGKGDDAGVIANYIVGNICETRKDCVAFLSPSKEATVDQSQTNTMLTKIIEHRNKIQNSSYWFMDSGYKYRYDKYNDKYRYVPMNGDCAGLSARVEPYESPAGYRKGVLKNVVKLKFNPNKAQRDQLYSADVNPVMSQTGQGILLFGDKTGYGITSAFDRINVRRLFIAVEKAIATAANSFLFELNDEFTQTQFKNIVEPFLREIQGRRGITDFRVISDATVNTPEVIDQNKFKANIFIKPARSINVIELTFVATRTGIEFDEIVGSLT
jgi:hypothetical protein